MKLLFVSNLFPDAGAPVRGLDNATLLHTLCRHRGYEVRVIAPRSVLPVAFPWRRRTRWESRPVDDELEALYVPTPYIPRFGSRWNDRLMRRALSGPFSACLDQFRPGAVLASWLFPDGCAVSSLCRERRVPLVLITQGSDTHQYLEDPVRRVKIVASIDAAAAVICRSADLAARLAAAGVPGDKLRIVYNGVDRSTFFRGDRPAARRTLGIDPEEPALLFVGNLLPVKDPLFLLRAHARLNEIRRGAGLRPARLRLIGEGPLAATIQRETERLGSSGAVDLLGRLAPAEVALWMNASDAFCLSSVNEGFPNVLLEAMACGLPVVSTDVGGIRERIMPSGGGTLVSRGDLEGYVAALSVALSPAPGPPESNAPSWEETSDAYHRILVEAIGSLPCGGRIFG